ncbi:MAG: bifunctional diaminohydroxyphosphoribosylaminopyrimidine deaminase/5-amino-6-(5-phosphoribosylamino)uracil reductase RibD [Proteobacteria bacterium]|nr:bifunctional diaminohydroxyphosphoribosylaminopyrimidine deaminase/5-amino-6-(5-phosphoribosylamino)uracil reductase RibD [Pseudomonadota bacterium]
MAKNSDPPPVSTAADQRYMDIALTLARRGLGNVWPNPAVGCVIVKGGAIVGRGWTQPGGRPHAEIEALARAGKHAKDATAYVTLEPCSHQGETPPCADALIAAGVSDVVVAVEDPDSRVAGSGIGALKKAGLGVRYGVRQGAATEINAGFFSRILLGRPLITLKLATTLDGKIATATGHSQWITGDTARAAAHLMRAQHDAVLVGSGTALADDPMLTSQLPGHAQSRDLRIVLDGRLRLSAESRLLKTARDIPTWIVTSARADSKIRNNFKDLGAMLHEAPVDNAGHIDLNWTVQLFGTSGITRVMIEGGGQVAAAFLKARLVDRLAWFRAPTILGGDGLPAVESLGIKDVGNGPGFIRESVSALSPDCLETYRVTG